MNLKPQDTLVLLKLVSIGDPHWVYSKLAMELSMSASEIHAAMKRAYSAGLLIDKGDTTMPDAKNLEELLVYGVKYVFAPERGGLCMGMPTAHAAQPLCDRVAHDDTKPPVWPDPNGKVQGLAFSPLYKSVPDAARLDSKLYELLALVDAIRAGRTREKTLAIKEINIRLKQYVNRNNWGQNQYIASRRKTG